MTPLQAFLHAAAAADADSATTLTGGFALETGGAPLLDRALAPGRVVSERYKLRGRIGQGGMATVWAGDDMHLDRSVAVKFLSGDLVDDPEYRERFAAEARVSAKLQTPYVVQVYDQGTYQGVPFIVMERLHGEDLHARMKRESRLPIDLVATIANHAGHALKATHALAIVHRDLKPQNLFLIGDEREPTVKLLDFGVAKQAGFQRRLTATGVMLGSPRYMSPEQIRCERDVDGRADLWSLAVILYTALTGVRPFDGDLPALFLSITTARPVAPSRLCHDLPIGLDVFMEKALAVDRERRYTDAAAFIDAFGRALESWVAPNRGRSTESPRSAASLAARVLRDEAPTTRIALEDLQRASGTDILFDMAARPAAQPCHGADDAGGAGERFPADCAEQAPRWAPSLGMILPVAIAALGALSLMVVVVFLFRELGHRPKIIEPAAVRSQVKLIVMESRGRWGSF